MKACNRCNALRDEQEFYRRDNACKECRKALVRANRLKNLEYYQEYDRRRSNNPDRVKARADYAKTERGRNAQYSGNLAWQNRNKHKRKAHVLTGNAIRDGKLIKQPCEVCGAVEPIQAHHDDYSKPLDVRWLCVTHHAEHHALERARERERRKQEQKRPTRSAGRPSTSCRYRRQEI